MRVADDLHSFTVTWNPWYGCHKVSAGCRNCYMFKGNERRGLEWSDTVTRSETNFDLPLRKHRDESYVLKDRIVLTSMTSDFFIEEADAWRDDAWAIIRKRSDLVFTILTKRPERICDCLPADWDEGYPNVRLSVSAEDQDSWDRRVPLLSAIPAAYRDVFMAPMIGPVDTHPLLSEGSIDAVYLGGEYCDNARPCDYDWVLDVHDSCVCNDVVFYWRNCGTHFVKNGVMYTIPSIVDQSRISHDAALDHRLESLMPSHKVTVQTRLF